MKYNRCLLKLSGEALGNAEGIFDKKKLNDIASQIKRLYQEKKEIVIVVGGGNIWRGRLAETVGMEQTNGDYMGMLATLMNALALESVLNGIGIEKTAIFSTIQINKMAEPYYYKKVVEKLKDNYIAIMATGIGYSHFTTDTTASLVAIETKADVILMAKNGVDGVYDADPKTNPNACRFDHISMQELINRKLLIMDQTACSLALDGKINIAVFDINVPDNIYLAAHQKARATYVNGGKE